MIDQPWGVTAYGHGSIQAEPDHAVLRLAVNRIDASPKTSLEDAKNAVSAVRTSLRAHGIPDANVISSRVSVHSSWDGYGVGRKFLGHAARVEFSVRITQLDLVEPAVVDAVEAGTDEVLGISYETSRLSDLRSEAREQAVAAAHSKARLYAEAANVRLGPVVHIEDVDPDHAAPAVFRGGRSDPPAAETGGSDLAPGRVTVRAGVVLGFSIIR